MSGSIRESFERAFKDKNTANTVVKDYESDEDSEKEQAKQVERKRAKKRRRVTRAKPNKGRKQVSQFKVRTVPKKERVTSDKYPEILSVDKEFSTNQQQTELIIAESRFFEKDNTDSWSRGGEYKHMRPVDYLFVRALIQRPKIAHFDIHQMNDKERLRANVELVTRRHETEFLCEPSVVAFYGQVIIRSTSTKVVIAMHTVVMVIAVFKVMGSYASTRFRNRSNPVTMPVWQEPTRPSKDHGTMYR